jgi:hypothetical protein
VSSGLTPGQPAGVVADDFQIVTPSVFFWQAYDPAVKCILSSCAIKTAAGLILIDPIPLEAAALAELAAGASPAAVVLTNGNHGRAAAAYRDRFGIPVLAPGDAVSDLEVTPDTTLADGDVAPGGLRVISLPGAGPGEIGLLGGRVICVGDAIINLDPEGLRLLPAKYCSDAGRLPDSLRKLLSCEFEVMTFAHGAPLVAAARQCLELLLA